MNDDVQVLDTGQDTDTSTYTPYEVIGFENGTLVTPASADLETGQVTMPVYSGKAPINATNLNHLEQGLKDLETHVLDLPDVENSLASDSIINAPSIHAVNELVNYSTTEKIVGKWIDNKPVYKKVILTTTPAEKTNAEIYDCTNENIDTLIKCDSLIISSVSGDILNGNYYYSDTNNCCVFYNSMDKSINMRLNSDMYHSETCYILLEYTKTTD